MNLRKEIVRWRQSVLYFEKLCWRRVVIGIFNILIALFLKIVISENILVKDGLTLIIAYLLPRRVRFLLSLWRWTIRSFLVIILRWEIFFFKNLLFFFFVNLTALSDFLYLLANCPNFMAKCLLINLIRHGVGQLGSFPFLLFFMLIYSISHAIVGSRCHHGYVRRRLSLHTKDWIVQHWWKMRSWDTGCSSHSGLSLTFL